ncbi:glycerophosphodiester phosphodiesterase [Candidatus Bathyarchaeota archaeon]|nr:glycerophosphodiester phosphodiesterase [Candidatus Bathyarchaeota archaeon]
MIKVTGHRGAAGLEPENTLRSIRRAIDLGVDRVEIDVRVTRDGRLVVIHDETVDRTTNGHGYVNELTLDEIRKLNAGKGEKVPTLEEVLEITRGKVELQIELKVPEATGSTLRLIERENAEGEVIITSFIHDLLRRAHDFNPELRTGALFFNVEGDICRKALNVYSKAIHVYYRNVDAELVRHAHEMGLEIEVWNPDEPKEMMRMIKLGVDSIGTNRPDILLNLLRKMNMR